MGTSNLRRISGIDPKNVVDEYKDRAFRELSDAEVFDQVCRIVSRPRVRGLTSFTLHAPLEVMARYGLMRLVEPSDRELARLQMVASAAVYGHQVELMPDPTRVYSFPDANTAALELAAAFTSGDADGMEALVLSVARQFGSKSLVNLLTPLALPTLTGASHSHIGLWLLLRHAEQAGVENASLLRAAARALVGKRRSGRSDRRSPRHSNLRGRDPCTRPRHFWDRYCRFDEDWMVPWFFGAPSPHRSN